VTGTRHCQLLLSHSTNNSLENSVPCFQELGLYCDAVSNIRTNLFGSSIINDAEISSLKPTQLLDFIKALKLEKEL